MANKIKHIFIVIALIGMLVVYPAASHFDFFGEGGTDDVTGASVAVPDKPSGDFIILVNNSLHADSMDDWKTFFSGEDMPVIFDDIECLVASADGAGLEMADRYRIQLPENQMTVRTEDSTMLASKAENGYIDVAIFSSEIADSIGLDPSRAGDKLTVIRVNGASDDNAADGEEAAS